MWEKRPVRPNLLIHCCMSLPLPGVLFRTGEAALLHFKIGSFGGKKAFPQCSYYGFYAVRHQKTAKFSICCILSVWTGRHFPVLELGFAVLFTRMANLPTFICKMLHRYRWKPWKRLVGARLYLKQDGQVKRNSSVVAQCILPSGQLQKITKLLV